MTPRKKTVYVLLCNHFDNTWRRCWDQPFYHQGNRFSSYREIERHVLEDCLEASTDGEFTFMVESSQLLRAFIEDHPKSKDHFKRLYDEGRFELLGAGEVIPDTNMPMGESLVRNLVNGILWAEQELGIKIHTGWHADGFGSCSQMPQLFRQVELEWLAALSYKRPEKDYWKGLDGTLIYCKQHPSPYMTSASLYYKYPPCGYCKGEGCEVCGQRGYDQSIRIIPFPDTYTVPPFAEADFSVHSLGGEEILPPENLTAELNAMEEQNPDVAFTYATYRTLAHRLEEDLQQLDHPDPQRIEFNPDSGNPSSSGCLVSRIKLKQLNRFFEFWLMALEKMLTLKAWNDPSYTFPQDEFRSLWQRMSFTQFHDAITATHIDDAYEELRSVFQGIRSDIRRIGNDADMVYQGEKNRVYIFNPFSWTMNSTGTIRVMIAQWVLDDLGIIHPHLKDESQEPLRVYERDVIDDYVHFTVQAPVLPPGEFRSITVYENPHAMEGKVLAGSMVENEYFLIEVGKHGIEGIFDKKNNQHIVRTQFVHANELILERDEGDPWATRSLYRPREPLAAYNHLPYLKRMDHYTEIIYTGRYSANDNIGQAKNHQIMILEWEQVVVLRDDIDRIDFITRINWNSFHHRIRVVFPTFSKTDITDQEVPFGIMRRKRYEMQNTGWNNANGDYPIINWAATTDTEPNVALFNRGLPSFRMEDGMMMLSLVRSPAFPNCLYEPAHYDVWNFDGMRDSGLHRFDYAITTFSGSPKDGRLVECAAEYNYDIPVSAKQEQFDFQPTVEASTTLLQTIKPTENPNHLGYALRLYEAYGEADVVRIHVPTFIQHAEKTNLLERSGEPLSIEDGVITFSMRPFEIATVVVK
jgi:alpha-mannosidase